MFPRKRKFNEVDDESSTLSSIPTKKQRKNNYASFGTLNIKNTCVWLVMGQLPTLF